MCDVICCECVNHLLPYCTLDLQLFIAAVYTMYLKLIFILVHDLLRPVTNQCRDVHEDSIVLNSDDQFIYLHSIVHAATVIWDSILKFESLVRNHSRPTMFIYPFNQMHNELHAVLDVYQKI